MYLCDGGVGSNVSEADMKAPQVKHYIPLIPIANILDSIPTIMPTDNTCSLCLSPHILPAGTRCCKNKYICLMCWCEYLKAGHRRCPLCCQVDSFMAGVKNLAVFVAPIAPFPAPIAPLEQEQSGNNRFPACTKLREIINMKIITVLRRERLARDTAAAEASLAALDLVENNIDSDDDT